MSSFILSDLSVSEALAEGNESSTLRLDDIHLTLLPGEWLTIVGVNGSGKTTLARILAGLTIEGATGVMNRGFAGDRPLPMSCSSLMPNYLAKRRGKRLFLP